LRKAKGEHKNSPFIEKSKPPLTIYENISILHLMKRFITNIIIGAGLLLAVVILGFESTKADSKDIVAYQSDQLYQDFSVSNFSFGQVSDELYSAVYFEVVMVFCGYLPPNLHRQFYTFVGVSEARCRSPGNYILANFQCKSYNIQNPQFN
jgi:hypothetical protein